MATSPTRVRAHAWRGLIVAIASLTLVALVPSWAQAEPSRTIEQVEAQIAQLGREAERASEAYNAAKIAQEDGRRKLDQLTASIADQEAKVKTLQGSMAGFAAAAYKAGGVDSTIALFVTDNPGDFLAQASSLDGVARRQSEAFRQIAVARQRLAQDKAVADQQQVTLDAAQAEIATQKAAVEAKQAEQQQVLDSLKADERRRLDERRAQEAAASAQRAQSMQVASRSSRPAETAEAPEMGVPSSDRAAGAVAFALAQVGKPYRYGATGPNSYDCSGLTMAAYASVGVSLPHHSGSQYSATRKISRDELQPGDLIFSYRPISHVSMYIGGGQVVHASTSGKPVKIASVDWGDFVGASRP